MHEETLKFIVTLSGTYWDKRPQYSIWVDDRVVAQSEIHEGENLIVFERTIAEGNHTLKIRLDNKTIGDTITENGTIVKDLLLNIDNITIDGNKQWAFACVGYFAQ